jgi:hypothetical protein
MTENEMKFKKNGRDECEKGKWFSENTSNIKLIGILINQMLKKIYTKGYQNYMSKKKS